MKNKKINLFIFIFLGIIVFILFKSLFFYPLYPVYPKGAKDFNGFTKKDEKRVNFGKENNSEAKYYLFLPNKKRATGQAVIICPGGGYQFLAYKNEGINVGKWFSKNGIAAVVLLYRMPNKKYNYIPLEDIHETIKIVRNNSKKWNINPEKVGVMGFSAGGHLAATASNHYDKLTKPNFSILYYPVISMDNRYTNWGTKLNLLGNNDEKLTKFYSIELNVTSQTPPTYIVFSKDDITVDPINSKIYYEKLKKNKVPVEMHIYEKGEHGWGWSKKFEYYKENTQSLLKWLKSL